MTKKVIEVFEERTPIVFIHKNRLLKGIIGGFNIYDSKVLKYKICCPKLDEDFKDISSDDIFENKEAYIDYIKKLEL